MSDTAVQNFWVILTTVLKSPLFHQDKKHNGKSDIILSCNLTITTWRVTQPSSFTYHISHASGAFLEPINGSSVKLLQGRLPLGQQLVWEVTVKQNLLLLTGQSQNWNAH